MRETSGEAELALGSVVDCASREIELVNWKSMGGRDLGEVEFVEDLFFFCF